MGGNKGKSTGFIQRWERHPFWSTLTLPEQDLAKEEWQGDHNPSPLALFWTVIADLKFLIRNMIRNTGLCRATVSACWYDHAPQDSCCTGLALFETGEYLWKFC
jgi:hypothetical protein